MNTTNNLNDCPTKPLVFMSDITFWGLAILLICTVMNTSKFGASFSWVILPCVLIILGWLFRAINNVIPLRMEHLCIFLLWLVFFVSTAFSDMVELQRDIATFLIFCFVLLCATSLPCSQKQLRRIVNIYIVVALIVEINIIYNWISHNYYVAWFKRASFSFWGVYRDPNYVMAFVLPAVALIFIKLINEKSVSRKILNGIILAISVLSIMASGSRSPMIGFVLFVVVYFLTASDMSFMKKLIILFSGLVAVSIAVYLVQKYYPTQSLNRLLSTEDARQELWKAALDVFKNHPIIGGGMSAASITSNMYAGNYSHNVYIDILCNSGIIGSVIFIVYFCSSSLKTTKINRAFIYSMAIAFMLPMFFVNGFNTATFYTPLILMSLISKYCSRDNTHYLDFLIKG